MEPEGLLPCPWEFVIGYSLEVGNHNSFIPAQSVWALFSHLCLDLMWCLYHWCFLIKFVCCIFIFLNTCNMCHPFILLSFLSLILSLWLLSDEYKVWSMTWQRWLVTVLSPWRPGFFPRLAHVGFVVKKIILGQVFLHVLQFSHQCHSTSALLTFIHLFIHLFIPSIPPSPYR
jgi:hypothetical protein